MCEPKIGAIENQLNVNVQFVSVRVIYVSVHSAENKRKRIKTKEDRRNSSKIR